MSRSSHSNIISDFNTRTGVEDEEQYLIIRRSIQWEDVTVFCLYTLSARVPGYPKQMLMDLKGDIASNKIKI